MIVLIDLTVLDASKLRFFPKLKRYLDDRDIDYKVVKTRKDIPVDSIDKITGVIMSGSSLRFTQSMDVDRLSVELYFLTNLTNVPILGICFGCQLINFVHGGFNCYTIIS